MSNRVISIKNQKVLSILDGQTNTDEFVEKAILYYTGYINIEESLSPVLSAIIEVLRSVNDGLEEIKRSQIIHPILQIQNVEVENEKMTAEEKRLLKMFNTEFGRPFSPIEIDLFMEWLKKYRIIDIEKALKTAVFQGKWNLRYIEKILQNWEKSGKKP